MKSNRQTKPRARKEGLIIQPLPDETLVYDLERDRAHCLNQTASLIWESCDGQSTTKEIARKLTTNLDQAIDEKIVWLALDQLDRNHLLAEHPTPPPALRGLSRREMVRVLGVSAAVAIPVVASIIAPTPAEAATGCSTVGQACGVGCCSGCTCDPQTNTCVGSC